MAITATFLSSPGALRLFGDGNPNSITASRDTAGSIFVNGGAVAVEGAIPRIANVTTIVAQGFVGDDVISLDETNGALPRAEFHGNSGNDVLTGGSRFDQLYGDEDNDALYGGADFDI